MAEYVTEVFEKAKINSEWILRHARELDALFGYNSKEMLVMNQVRALSAIDTMMDSLRELKGNIEELTGKTFEEKLVDAVAAEQEVNQGNGSVVPVFEQEYVVEFAVNGRAYVDARGCSPAEAARAAEGSFGDVDLRLAKSPAAPGCSLHAPAGAVGELDCVDYKAAIAYNDNDEVFEGYDVETGCSDMDGEQDYTVGFEVDARACVSVKAVDTVEAVQKACRKVGELDFGGLECIAWKAVKVTDAKGKVYDDERDLFGPAQAGVDRLIAGAERRRSGVNKGHGVRSAEDLERV